jgi:Ca-activated chloride channel family protein
MAAAALGAVGTAIAFVTPNLVRHRVAVGELASARQRPAPGNPATVAALPQPDEAESPKLTKEQEENLRSLGYLAESSGPVPPAKNVERLPLGRSFGQTLRLVPGVSGGEHDAAAHDMYFEHKGTNPFVATEEDHLSTFGLDVDTASYAMVRNYLSRGQLPPPEAVRVEEFVNAMPQDYEAPRRETFAIHLEGSAHPFHRGYHLLRVGLKAREVRARDRKPAVLTFVIDVSGSMDMENRLGLVKRSLKLLVDRLGERDRIGIVVYGTRGRVILDPTPATERGAILGAIRSLRPEGSTNLDEGLDLGYEMAQRFLDPEGVNRVVLCTDGVANNGVTDASKLLARIHTQSEKRVFLTALGFGMGNYNDALLQRLADEGDGQYAYIDDYAEAERFFLRDLTGVLEVVAREAKAQVEFDPSRVESYRLLGYEKRDVTDQDFRNDQVDGGEVGPGHTVTAVYELKLTGRGGDLGTVRVRYTDPDTGSVTEQREDIDPDGFRGRFRDASPSFRRTVLAARFAEHLRRSRWVRNERLDDVVDEAERLPGGSRRSPETTELVELMREAIALSAPRD